MDILLTTINLPVVPFIAAVWFVGYIVYEVGRCSAIHDILDAGADGRMPVDIETWRKNWVDRKINSKIRK